MTESPRFFDLLLQNGRVATPSGIVETDIAVRDGKIAALGQAARETPARETLDCTGLHILPGVIDAHVHFREPGLTHKEDIRTGTLAAITGGVTTIFEMPNTDPLTVTAATLLDKLARAEGGGAYCDFAFYIGGCAENAGWLDKLERLPGCAGVKVFMGSSTGSLLTAEDDDLLRVLQNGQRRLCLHAEDEARLTARKHLAAGGDVHSHPVWRDEACALTAVRRAIALARKTGRRLHFLHVTSAGEIDYLRSHKDIATVETTPQHLTLAAPNCYDRLGTRAQMNPPIRDSHHRDALWQGIADGTIDVLGSDHAPHTPEEKSRPYPQSPSGMPGVQTLLPVMLDHVQAGKLSLERLVDLTAHGPQRVYGIAGKGRIAVGYDADFAVVDLGRRWTITDRWIRSKCGWTPFDGRAVTGYVQGTVLRGQIVQWDGEITPTAAANPPGAAVRFSEVLLTDANIPGDEIITPPRQGCCP